MTLRPLLAALGLATAAIAHATPLAAATTQALEHQLDELGGPTFERHDYEKYARETFPALIELSGGHDKFMAQMRTAFAQMDAQHVKFVSHMSKSESQSTPAGKYEVVRLTEDSVLEAAGKRLRVISYSLAVRAKPAGAWTFIGGSGLAKNPEVLWMLLPELPKDYKLPPYSMQPI